MLGFSKIVAAKDSRRDSKACKPCYLWIRVTRSCARHVNIGNGLNSLQQLASKILYTLSQEYSKLIQRCDHDV